jgi:hypothetical protein
VNRPRGGLGGRIYRGAFLTQQGAPTDGSAPTRRLRSLVTSQTGCLRSSTRTIAHSDRRIEVLVSNLLPVDIPEVYYSGPVSSAAAGGTVTALLRPREGSQAVLFVIEGMHRVPSGLVLKSIRTSMRNLSGYGSGRHELPAWYGGEGDHLRGALPGASLRSLANSGAQMNWPGRQDQQDWTSRCIRHREQDHLTHTQLKLAILHIESPYAHRSSPRHPYPANTDAMMSRRTSLASVDEIGPIMAVSFRAH